jgi:hypothetical protein
MSDKPQENTVEWVLAGVCDYAEDAREGRATIEESMADLVRETWKEAQGAMGQKVYVVLSEPGPHQEFVECETTDGRSVKVGMTKREDGYWVLGPFLRKRTEEG